VNDPFVMEAWGADLNCAGKVTMLADTNAEFTKALGMEQTLAALGGVRSKRYALLVSLHT
jgi:2-Cys peroxiredoxin 5